MTASTNFSSGTVVTSTWLNAVDRHIFDEYISVTDYGAVGDGVTDDTAAFTAAQGNGNVTLTVPPGTYVLNNLRIKTGVRLLGAGYESTIIKQGAPGNYAIACTSDAAVGQLSSVELSGFKVVGAASATVAAVIVSASGVYAIWKSKFDFVASLTYRALEVQAASANNVFRCEFKVTSQDTTDTAVIINGGTYNTFDFFLTNCSNGRALDFTGLACFFVRSVSDGQQKFAGSHTVANNVTVEEWSGSALASQAAIESNGFSETFINPLVILTVASAGKIDFAFRPFDNTVYLNPKVLAPVLSNPFQADNAFKFTLIGPGQSTTTNKMNTVFLDTNDTTQTLRRVNFVGDCSQWVENNRPSGGKSIQYATPVAGATVAVLNNTDILVLQPAGALATLTLALANLPVDGQVLSVSSTQTITTLTITAPTSGANIAQVPTAITSTTPFQIVYQAANNTQAIKDQATAFAIVNDKRFDDLAAAGVTQTAAILDKLNQTEIDNLRDQLFTERRRGDNREIDISINNSQNQVQAQVQAQFQNQNEFLAKRFYEFDNQINRTQQGIVNLGTMTASGTQATQSTNIK